MRISCFLFLFCVCLVILTCSCVWRFFLNGVNKKFVLNYKPWFKVKQNIGLMFFFCNNQISGPPRCFPRIFSTTFTGGFLRSVCTSSKLAMTNPWSLEPKVVLKQHPCRQSSGGAAVGFLLLISLGQVECIGKHPKGIHERGVFCWIIWVFNYHFFSKWTPWSCMGLLAACISDIFGDTSSTLAPQVSFHRSWAIRKWESKNCWDSTKPAPTKNT